MTDEPILLYLHGVTFGPAGDEWRPALDETMRSLGYADLTGVRVVAPKYGHALRGWDEKVTLPDLTVKQPTRDAARQLRRDFERRMGAVEFRLGRADDGWAHPVGEHLHDAAIMAVANTPRIFAQAKNYVSNAQIRAQVLRLILDALPDTGRVTIVGHSLGSVIAADLLRRLPAGIEVSGLITIGSPLAAGVFDVDNVSSALKDPPPNLDWWINVWNAADPIALNRGVSSVFPWIVDFGIDTGVAFTTAHFAVQYLTHPLVASAVGYGLFGSLSRELVHVAAADIPLDAAETTAYLALRYAHLALRGLSGEKQDRFAGALRSVQANVVEEIRQRNAKIARPFPTAIARLAFDYSDVTAVLPEPAPFGYVSKEEAIVPLTVLAAENVILPFEITVPKDVWRKAMEDLAAEMSLGSAFGAGVFESLKTAHDVLTGGPGVNWIKVGAIGAGAAALVVATGGLALAAAPGLAGAAAITGALAAFGPGGMIGGLLTAGGLMTAGGGGIAFGLAKPGTSAAALEVIVERRLAAEILRKTHGLDRDPAVWEVLRDLEMQVSREHERLDEFSDPDAPSIKELKRKLETTRRALKYLADNGLGPLTAIEASSVDADDFDRDFVVGTSEAIVED